MSRRMYDETTIRETMYPEIDHVTFDWLKDFNLETLTGDNKKRYDEFVQKYVRIGGFTFTENDRYNYPIPYRYELVYWKYKDVEHSYRATFQCSRYSEFSGTLTEVRTFTFDFDGSDYSTTYAANGPFAFAPLLYTNTFSIKCFKPGVGVNGIADFAINFTITQNRYSTTVKIKEANKPQTATNDLILKLTNTFATYPATGFVKFSDGDVGQIIGLKAGWKFILAYTNGTTEELNMAAYFDSTQSVSDSNADRYITWTEACRAVNSF